MNNYPIIFSNSSNWPSWGVPNREAVITDSIFFIVSLTFYHLQLTTYHIPFTTYYSQLTTSKTKNQKYFQYVPTTKLNLFNRNIGKWQKVSQIEHVKFFFLDKVLQTYYIKWHNNKCHIYRWVFMSVLKSNYWLLFFFAGQGKKTVPVKT